MRSKYEIRSAVFFILAVVYWCLLLFVFAYLAGSLDLKNHAVTIVTIALWMTGTAFFILFGIINLFKARHRDNQTYTRPAQSAQSNNNYTPVPESKRLAEMTERLKAGEMNYIPWIYTFLTSKHPEIVKTAATTLANFVDTMDPKYLIRFDEQFRSTTSIEWSIDWGKVDISRIASILGKDKTFIWMMRLGTFNPNGYYREKCVRILKSDPGSYIFLLIRLRDWVPEVREAARNACCDISMLSFYELVNCLSALDKVKRSGRVDVYFLRDLEKKISERIVQLSPGYSRSQLKGFDVPTRRALYRILLENKRLGKDEVKAILNSENQAQCLYYVMSLYIDSYELTAEELDEFMDHRSFSVQRKAIEQKYKLAGNSWPGLEDKLLSPSTPVRELARFILKKHEDFDCREYYLERFGSSDKKACIAGLGETGNIEDAARILPFLEDPDPATVKITLHALGNLGGEKYSGVFWKYLQDKRQNVAIQSFREITRFHIRYGAEQIYELIEKTDSDLLKVKLAYRLSHEAYWDRVPYALMLYSHEDEKVRETVRLALAWKRTYAYSGTTEANAKRILEILDDEKYQIRDSVKEYVRFNLEHAVKK